MLGRTRPQDRRSPYAGFAQQKNEATFTGDGLRERALEGRELTAAAHEGPYLPFPPKHFGDWLASGIALHSAGVREVIASAWMPGFAVISSLSAP